MPWDMCHGTCAITGDLRPICPLSFRRWRPSIGSADLGNELRKSCLTYAFTSSRDSQITAGRVVVVVVVEPSIRLLNETSYSSELIDATQCFLCKWVSGYLGICGVCAAMRFNSEAGVRCESLF